MNATDFIAHKSEHDEVGRFVKRNLSIINNHRGTAIDDAGTEYPPFSSGIGTVILVNFALTLFLELAHKIEFDILGQHRADGIKIAYLETLDIYKEPKAHCMR